MKILRSLTLKDLKLNKKRTIGTIIGIILSCALITVIGLFFESMRYTLFNNEVESKGYWHVQLFEVSANEINELRNNRDFNHLEMINIMGETLDDPDGYSYSGVVSMDKDSFDYLKYNLISGEFPKNKNEIAVNNAFATNFDLKIGDTVTMDIGDVISPPEKLGLEIQDGHTYTFKISGLLNEFSNNVTTGYESESYSVYLTLKNPDNYKKDINELLGTEDYNDREESPKYGYSYSVNKSLLQWEVLDMSDRIMSVFVGVLSVVISIVMIASIFAIRNSFAISISEKIKTYGMLSSIGATKKQIRKMVLFEGFVLGLIGISLGLLLGISVTWLLTVIINAIIAHADLGTLEILFKFKLYPVIIAIITGAVVIYLSVITSAFRASRVSPIQNIRNSDDIKIKKLKTPRLINKIFGIGGVLSYKNLKRSKKKYRVTIISLTVSIMLFITASSLVEYGLRTIKEEYSLMNYNVYAFGVKLNDETILKKVQAYDGAHTKYHMDLAYYSLDDSHIVAKDSLTEQFGMYDFYLYDADTFKEYAKKVGVNYEKVKDKIIVINDYIDESVRDKKVYKEISDYKAGDSLELIHNNTKNKLSFEIGAVTTERTYGIETYYNGSLKIIGNYDYFKDYSDDENIDISVDYVLFDSKDPYKLADDLKELNEELDIENIDDVVNKIKAVILILSIMVYGFIIVVTLIGVTSVFNTINSNMDLRSKDFATLKSVGMTKREFNSMINLEAIFYSFKSLLYGIILGLIGSYLAFTAFTSGYNYNYQLPINSILAAVVFVVVIVLIIMRYSIKKINKQNIIETIRNSNI